MTEEQIKKINKMIKNVEKNIHTPEEALSWAYDNGFYHQAIEAGYDLEKLQDIFNGETISYLVVDGAKMNSNN